jgi:hypothetical protein
MAMTMSVADTSVTPQGWYELTLEISNPGPDTATVVVRAVTSGETRWRPGQLDVAAGYAGQLTVVGRGSPDCAAATPPWGTGDLLVNGTPTIPTTDAPWCASSG